MALIILKSRNYAPILGTHLLIPRRGSLQCFLSEHDLTIDKIDTEHRISNEIKNIKPKIEIFSFFSCEESDCFILPAFFDFSLCLLISKKTRIWCFQRIFDFCATQNACLQIDSSFACLAHYYYSLFSPRVLAFDVKHHKKNWVHNSRHTKLSQINWFSKLDKI